MQQQINSFIYAKQGQIPPIQFTHDSNITDNNGKTIQYYLEEHKLPIPNCWYQKMPKHLNSIQIEQAIYNQPIQQTQNYKSHYQNNDGWTVAMILARFNRQIPKQWHHDRYIMNKYGQTVEDILKQQNIQIPKEWKCNQRLKNLKKQFYKYSNIPFNYNFKPDFHNNPTNETFKEYLIRNGVQLNNIPKYYRQYQDINNGMNQIIKKQEQEIYKLQQKLKEQIEYNKQQQIFEQARQGKLPDSQYQFNPEIKDNEGHTICYYLWNNGVMVPDKWQDEQYKNPKRKKGDRSDRTLAMQQVIKQKKIPQKKYYHNPNITNKNNMTVAMILASYGIIPPKQWFHNSELKTNNGLTVAMKLANKGIIPPRQWQHNPNIKDKYGNTVEIYLIENGKPVPPQWQTH